jgi:hypothetical protein
MAQREENERGRMGDNLLPVKEIFLFDFIVVGKDHHEKLTG